MNAPTSIEATSSLVKTPFTFIAEGVELRMLRRDSEAGMTFLIRMCAGAIAPRHGHPGGEDTYMIEGSLRIRGRVSADGGALPDIVLFPGDFASVAPGETHDGIADGGALFLVVAPGGVTHPR